VSEDSGEIGTMGDGGTPPARTRRWMAIGAAALVLVIGVVIVVVIARDDAEPSTTGAPVSADTTTAAPTTRAMTATTTAPTEAPTTAPVTTSASTTSPVTTTTVGGAAAPGFDPPCVESTSVPTGTGPDPATLAAFGPLPADPALTIELPASIADPSLAPGEPTVQSPMVFPIPISGGVLLPVRASSTGYFPGALLAAVDAGGSKRWVRCFDDDVVDVLAGAGPEALVSFSQSSAATWAPQFRVISLADGAVGDTLADRLAAQGIDAAVTEQANRTLASEGSVALLGPDTGVPVDPARQQLLLVDLDTLQATALPLPELPGVAQVGDARYAVDPDGNPMVLSGSLQPAALAVLRGGAWTTEPGELASAFPLTVEFDVADAPSVLRAVDALGQTVWTNDAVTDLSAEGFRAAVSGDVTVVRGCFAPRDPATNFCPDVAIAGVRSADGEVLWRLAGDRLVSAVGDGFALVADGEPQPDGTFAGSGWMMIDTTTGVPVHGQHWDDPTTFEYECCGGGDFVHVTRAGAVVFAVNERRVTVWYPASTALAPHTVGLP
jgi:hypothetical protein